MALVSVLPRRLDVPLPLEVVADLAGRAGDRVIATRPHPDAHPGTRWHVRLRSTAHYDVWLIGWGPGSAVEMHDHGGSVGALVPISGELIEHTPRAAGGIRRQVLAIGDVHAFESGHRHRVANETAAGATSVHVYSPPLTAMTFYDDDRVTRSEPVDLPPLIEDRRA